MSYEELTNDNSWLNAHESMIITRMALMFDFQAAVNNELDVCVRLMQSPACEHNKVKKHCAFHDSTEDSKNFGEEEDQDEAEEEKAEDQKKTLDSVFYIEKFDFDLTLEKYQKIIKNDSFAVPKSFNFELYKKAQQNGQNHLNSQINHQKLLICRGDLNRLTKYVINDKYLIIWSKEEI